MSAQAAMRDANSSRMILTVLGACLMPSVRRCWKMAYIMWMASSATRSITTDLSSRVACMQQASPAPTVITLIQGSCAKPEICSAGSATPPSDSTSVRIHHHAPNSKGAECVSCHMPTTTYMGIDARRDHSIRIPRPDRTVLLGTPNACNQCHTDKSAKWAKDAIKAWYPSPKPGFQDFAEAFERADLGAPGAQLALIGIAEGGTEPPIARASAIARLGRFPSPQVLEFAARSLKIDDPQIRAAAVSVIAGADRRDASVASRAFASRRDPLGSYGCRSGNCRRSGTEFVAR